MGQPIQAPSARGRSRATCAPYRIPGSLEGDRDAHSHFHGLVLEHPSLHGWSFTAHSCMKSAESMSTTILSHVRKSPSTQASSWHCSCRHKLGRPTARSGMRFCCPHGMEPGCPRPHACMPLRRPSSCPWGTYGSIRSGGSGSLFLTLLHSATSEPSALMQRAAASETRTVQVGAIFHNRAGQVTAVGKIPASHSHGLAAGYRCACPSVATAKHVRPSTCTYTTPTYFSMHTPGYRLRTTKHNIARGFDGPRIRILQQSPASRVAKI